MQVGDIETENVDFYELYKKNGEEISVTWCDEKIYENDIEYRLKEKTVIAQFWSWRCYKHFSCMCSKTKNGNRL